MRSGRQISTALRPLTTNRISSIRIGSKVTRPLISKRTVYKTTTQPTCQNYPPWEFYEDIVLVNKLRDGLRLQKDAESDMEDLPLATPLGTAIEFQYEDVVRFLLKKGANPNGCSNMGDTSHLGHSAKTHNQEIFLMLLDHGAFPRESGALWEAAKSGNIAAAKILIERGVNVNEVLAPTRIDMDRIDKIPSDWEEGVFLTGFYDGTPLHVAVSEGQVDMVRFLLSVGARKNLKDSYNMTPLDWIKHRDVTPKFGELTEEQNCWIEMIRLLEGDPTVRESSNAAKIRLLATLIASNSAF